MPNSLQSAIRKTCEAIHKLPHTEASLQEMLDRGIERGKYDMTLLIRGKLTEILRFLEAFERTPMLKSSRKYLGRF